MVPVERRVFISSTNYDLTAERKAVETFLRSSHNENVVFTPVLNESEDFPLRPLDIASKHSYDLCLDVLRTCEFVVLLLKSRYGDPIVNYNGRSISITHREYAEAFAKRIPLLVFVGRALFDARQNVRRGSPQDVVAPKHMQLFEFLEEILKQKRNNWVNLYDSADDIVSILQTQLVNFDSSDFVDDVTVPDGTIIKTKSRFEKVWAIRNTGNQVWRERCLVEENPGISGLMPDQSRIAIPVTRPGETVSLRVTFTAPSMPASCTSYWKMIDASGGYCLPNMQGLRCNVKVSFG